MAQSNPAVESSYAVQGKGIRDSVLQAIGNTPVVRLRKVVTPSMADVVVKLEYYIDKNEGVVKRHFFSAMLCSTAWNSERWRTEALKLSR